MANVTAPIANFLVSLPAILGIVGFVVYLILRKSVTQDPIIAAIIKKLEFEERGFYRAFKELPDGKKESILRSDQELRERISTHDRQILDRALSNQFKTNIFVYSLCGFLLLLGIGLYLWQTPRRLELDNIQLTNSIGKEADNQLVDINPLYVTWTTKGRDEVVYAVLENLETGKQTHKLRVQASEGRIKFVPDKYTNFDKVLSNRTPNESNRIRAILYAPNGDSFVSKEAEVKVGVRIVCYAELPDKIKFNALVDQVIVNNFHFAPKLALFKSGFSDRTIFEAPTYEPEPELVISQPSGFDKNNAVLSINPRDIMDATLYSSQLEDVRDAIASLQKGH